MFPCCCKYIIRQQQLKCQTAIKPGYFTTSAKYLGYLPHFSGFSVNICSISCWPQHHILLVLYMLSLVQHAQSVPQHTAIRSQQESFTYQQLLDASAAVSNHLLGDLSDLAEARIAFIVPPGFDYVRVQWGIWRAGGIAVPLCVDHPLPALQYTLEDSDARILIVAPDYEALLTDWAQSKGIRLIRLEDLTPNSSSTRLPDILPERRAMILYTSGTTSLPKGVVSTHENIEAQIVNLVTAWEWSSSDHILCVLPLHHVHGIINVISCALWAGACVEFLPRFDAEKVFERFLAGEINLFMAVPTIYYKLIRHYEAATPQKQAMISTTLKRFRLMVSGSAALPISVLEQWRKISGQTLLERYGMTEIGMAVSNSYRGERRPGHIGLPLPSVELRLVDEAEEIVPPGIAGEIQVKGPSVFREYWQKPAATAESFTTDGWFRTGDMAVFNQGSYRILGRNSVDIIKSGGYKISALEIEEVLRAHPTISDCAVVGIPDEEWGEIVAASLILNSESIDLAELTEWLKSRLPAYKIPRRYIFQTDLPRNTLGKVTKNELKKDFT